MSKVTNNIWLWKDPDERWKDKVITHLKAEEPTEADILVLHCEGRSLFEESIPLIYYLFDLCMRFKVFNEKIMLLNYKDFLLAIELCLEKFLLKENEEETDEDKTDKFGYLQLYINNLKQTDECSSNQMVSCIKTFLAENNCIDVWQMVQKLQVYRNNNSEFANHLSKTKFLILEKSETNFFREIVGTLSLLDTLAILNVETPLNSSFQESPPDDEACSKIHITCEITKIEDFSFDEITNVQLGSATKEYVQDVIISFLSLLVNSRNELALSKVLISPFIELNHTAFTHLKHLAKEKEMPLCQTAISFVSQVRLGGKGYAPSPECPMLAYIKNLELFVDTLNQLQVLLEEANPKTLLKRIINILKNKLMKCWAGKCKQNAIESAVISLHCIADKVLQLIKLKKFEKTSLICQETYEILYFFTNYVTCSSFTVDSDKALKEKQYKRTPINLPPLLGYFRSPEEESSMCKTESIINEDSIVSDTSSLGFPAPLMSYFHCSDNSCSTNIVCSDLNSPAKVNFMGCINKTEVCIDKTEDKAEVNVFCSPAKLKEQGKVKRSILRDITNNNGETPKERFTKKIKTETQKNKQIVKKEIKKTKLSKKFKLIKGQDKITSFFTVQKV